MRYIDRYRFVVGGSLGLLFAPSIAFAQFANLQCTAGSDVCPIIQNLEKQLLYPVVDVLLGASVLVFVLGIVEYLWQLRDGKPSPEGQKHMLYGLAGLFIVTASTAIMNMIAGTVVAFFH